MSDLPSSERRVTRLEMSLEQRSMYDSLLRQFRTADNKQRLAFLNQMREVCDMVPGTETSPKISRTIEIVEDALANDRKVTIFSFWNPPIYALAKELSQKYGPGAIEVVTGDVNAIPRAEAIARFRTDPTCKVLIASGRIAGEGLTLVESSVAIFVNKWWNPSAQMQAGDRLIRIGQEHHVDIHEFMMVDTIEERIKNILQNKTTIIDELSDYIDQSNM